MTIFKKPYICCSIPQKKPHFKPTDRAYTASAIDNDGSIYGRFIIHKDHGIGVSLSFGVQVSQNKNQLDYLKRFEEETGYGKAKIREKGTSQMSDWVVIKHDEIPALLKKLLRYFRIKKGQAKLLIKIVEKYSKLPKGNTEENRIKRAEGIFELLPLMDKLATLNDSPNRTVTGKDAFKAMQARGYLLDKEYKSP